MSKNNKQFDAMLAQADQLSERFGMSREQSRGLIFAAELSNAWVDCGHLPASRLVRRLRLSQGLTQEQLADLVNCSPSSIATYELGKTTATPQITDRILAALGHVGVMQIVVGLGIHGERHLKVIPNPLTQPATEPTNPTE